MLFDWGVLIKGIDVEGRLETLLGMLHGANDDRSLYLSRNTRSLKKKMLKTNSRLRLSSKHKLNTSDSWYPSASIDIYLHQAK